jgi:hypothetical protein
MAIRSTLATDRELWEINALFGGDLTRELDAKKQQNAGLKVLDIGCDEGLLSLSKLVELYPNVIGIGLRPEKTPKPFTSGRLQLVRGDLFTLPFHSSIDIAYSSHVFIYLCGNSMDEIKRTLCAGIYQASNSLIVGGLALLHVGVLIEEDIEVGTTLEDHLDIIEKSHPGYRAEYDVELRNAEGLSYNYLYVRRV